MSNFESIFWHVLGFAAMPTILIGGFMGVFFIALGLLKLTGNKPVENKA